MYVSLLTVCLPVHVGIFLIHLPSNSCVACVASRALCVAFHLSTSLVCYVRYEPRGGNGNVSLFVFTTQGGQLHEVNGSDDLELKSKLYAMSRT